MAYASGVDKPEGDALKIDGVFDGIAGGALNVAHDGTVFAQERIEECGFSNVWSTDDGNGNTVFQSVAGVERVGQTLYVSFNLKGELEKFGAVGKLQILMIGEVEFQFQEGSEP